MQAYTHFVAVLPRPRLHGHVTAMTERAVEKALRSKQPLKDGATLSARGHHAGIAPLACRAMDVSKKVSLRAMLKLLDEFLRKASARLVLSPTGDANHTGEATGTPAPAIQSTTDAAGGGRTEGRVHLSGGVRWAAFLAKRPTAQGMPHRSD